ncbi:hypothetical protein ABZ135_01185 [Streptomyces sp. NPDC006339]|uniref:hypothetical protein n=1 Tax=Streptomyces sp. NPDC006339 TaxID=3156755 RepID=UPI0033AFC84F
MGDGCLSVRSVAAGEMQARTVASYPVLPGTEYQAFADASGSTVPERIGIRWLNAASAEISISWSLTTSAASSSWHRIAVADVAPDAAAHAQVVFSSTPAAGLVSSFYENVYLGLPVRTTGNLLAANTETSERGSSLAYVAVTNCSISRTAPPVTWPVDYYLAGGHTITMTVTANGPADFRSTDLAPVTPGTEYLAYAYLNPPASGTAAWIELRFYNASSAQIQATRSVLSAPGTGWYRQRVADFAPAGAAYATVAFGLSTATAGQVMRIDQSVVIVAPDLREGSVVPYRDASFERDTGNWSVVSGVATLARLTPWGTDGLEGSYCMTVSSATATTSVIRSPRYAIGAAGGQTWISETGMKVAAGSFNFIATIRYYNAANTEIGQVSSRSTPVPASGWWLITETGSAPAGTTQAAIEYTLAATSASSVLRMDKVSLWQTLPITEVTANDDTASITITLRELPTTDTITVWRVTADGTRTLVRGPNGLIDRAVTTSDVLVIEDYEAPLGVPVSYYSESRSTSNALTASRTTSVVTLAVSDRNEAWLKDPAHPERNLKVLVHRAPDWDRPIAQVEHRVRRRRNSVIFSDVRGGLEGDLSVWTRTDAERASLHRLLDSGSVLLWQAAPGMGVDDMYVNVGQVRESRVTDYAPELWRAWTLPLKQADMPVTVGVASSAGRTWQDILTENATWGDVLAKYATWEDVLFHRPIGG